MIRLDVLIPAHNEEQFIEQTIAAARISLETASKQFLFQYRILIGCNGCTDQTAIRARELADEVFEWPAMGKWRTLQKLGEQTTADYIAFVDAGATWDSQIFTQDLWAQLTNPQTLGVTLSYNSAKLSIIEKIYWQIEAGFKNIEMKLGGLVAVSGISVFYQAAAVKKAFDFLNTRFPDTSWLNDDVILPLTLRFLEPGKSIQLAEISKEIKNPIHDLGLTKSSSEWLRRQRMMRGNLQWIRLFTPLFFKAEYFSSARLQIFIVLLRRLLKVFWAYFGVAFLIGVFSLFFDPVIISVVLAFIFVAFLYRPHVFKKIIYSAQASLMAPFDLLFWKDTHHNSRWG